MKKRKQKIKRIKRKQPHGPPYLISAHLNSYRAQPTPPRRRHAGPTCHPPALAPPCLLADMWGPCPVSRPALTCSPSLWFAGPARRVVFNSFAELAATTARTRRRGSRATESATRPPRIQPRRDIRRTDYKTSHLLSSISIERRTPRSAAAGDSRRWGVSTLGVGLWSIDFAWGSCPRLQFELDTTVTRVIARRCGASAP